MTRSGAALPRTRGESTTGSAGGRTSRSDSGARCVRTTRPTARAGNTFPTTTRAPGRTAGGGLGVALALWNGRGPILKERLFGLAAHEGNHGEDVKELYYYLDATPTSSYLKALYKYPQAEFPYAPLVEENRRRSRHHPEFELLDTGVFDGNRYFDVVAEYAKASPEDLRIRLTAKNRGPEPAVLHLLPTLWLRNTWSWGG